MCEGTQIPLSFNNDINRQEFWVAPNDIKLLDIGGNNSMTESFVLIKEDYKNVYK